MRRVRLKRRHGRPMANRSRGDGARHAPDRDFREKMAVLTLKNFCKKLLTGFSTRNATLSL